MIMFERKRPTQAGRPHRGRVCPLGFRLGFRAGVLVRLTAAALLSVVVIGARAAASDLPELGDASSRTISPQMERAIGRDFLKQIHASAPTISDPLLKYYVASHIAALTQHSELREGLLSTVIIDSDDINAFAAPGGVVGINLGLMLHAQDLHEYSSVMAHELAHLSQRHFARRIEEARAQALPSLAGLIGALVLGAVGGTDAALAAVSAAQASSISNQLRYSRTREQEADRIGMNTLVRAGMDPAGMSRMFERMQRAYRFSSRPPEFLLTHPLSETRVADARTQALDHRDSYRAPARQTPAMTDYALMRARAMVYYADSPQAAIKQFSKTLDVNPDDIGAEYGLALALAASGDHEQALLLSESLLGGNPQNILYLCTHAEFLIGAEREEDAIELLREQLAVNPDNAPLSMLFAKALSAMGNHEEAEEVLATQGRLRPTDVDVWYELAETSGLAGNIVGVHRARAEFFALHGSYQRAIQHLEYAQRIVREQDNFQLQSRISQRITDFRDLIRERSS